VNVFIFSFFLILFTQKFIDFPLNIIFFHSKHFFAATRKHLYSLQKGMGRENCFFFGGNIHPAAFVPEGDLLTNRIFSNQKKFEFQEMGSRRLFI